MITKEELWAMPIPTEKMKKRTYSEFPTNRKEWATYLYSYIFVMEESTCNWSVYSLPYFDEMILYFKTYDMPAMAWWVKNLKYDILSGEEKFVTDGPVALRTNTLRSMFHDEQMDPIRQLHTHDTREDIKLRYKLLKTSMPL